jgi:hypothetical protein
MPIAGLDDRAMRLAQKIVAKTERLLERTGLDEGAGIGRDPNDGAQRSGETPKRASPSAIPSSQALQSEWSGASSRKAQMRTFTSAKIKTTA